MAIVYTMITLPVIFLRNADPPWLIFILAIIWLCLWFILHKIWGNIIGSYGALVLKKNPNKEKA